MLISRARPIQRANWRRLFLVSNCFRTLDVVQNQTYCCPSTFPRRSDAEQLISTTFTAKRSSKTYIDTEKSKCSDKAVKDMSGRMNEYTVVMINPCACQQALMEISVCSFQKCNQAPNYRESPGSETYFLIRGSPQNCK
jgi:hypothetical protein